MYLYVYIYIYIHMYVYMFNHANGTQSKRRRPARIHSHVPTRGPLATWGLVNIPYLGPPVLTMDDFSHGYVFFLSGFPNDDHAMYHGPFDQPPHLDEGNFQLMQLGSSLTAREARR